MRLWLPPETQGKPTTQPTPLPPPYVPPGWLQLEGRLELLPRQGGSWKKRSIPCRIRTGSQTGSGTRWSTGLPGQTQTSLALPASSSRLAVSQVVKGYQGPEGRRLIAALLTWPPAAHLATSWPGRARHLWSQRPEEAEAAGCREDASSLRRCPNGRNTALVFYLLLPPAALPTRSVHVGGCDGARWRQHGLRHLLSNTFSVAEHFSR